jgi:hypothetical protein
MTAKPGEKACKDLSYLIRQFQGTLVSDQACDREVVEAFKFISRKLDDIVGMTRKKRPIAVEAAIKRARMKRSREGLMRIIRLRSLRKEEVED